MSMFDDVMGFGRTSVMESMVGEFEPEVEETTLESVAALDESVDPMDFILQVAYENEMNMKNLDMAIMAEEYMFLRESGQEMVYEETKMQSIVAKFKAGVMWLWEQIQKFFKTVLAKIETVVKGDKAFLKKYEAKAAGKTAKIKAFSGIMNISNIAIKTTTLLKDIGTKSGTIYDQCNNGNYANAKDIDTALGFIGLKPTNDKGMTELILEKICPEYKSTKSEQQISANDAITVVRDYADTKKTVKQVYNENKIAINGHLKLAKGLEKDAKDHAVLSTEKSKSIHTVIKVLNKYGSVLTMVNKTYISILNKARAQSRAVIVAAVGQTSTPESASVIDTVEFGMTF